MRLTIAAAAVGYVCEFVFASNEWQLSERGKGSRKRTRKEKSDVLLNKSASETINANDSQMMKTDWSTH